MFENKKSLKKEEEWQEELDALFARREHLKRQYLRYYKMEKIIKEQNKREKVNAIKRKIMHMIARD